MTLRIPAVTTLSIVTDTPLHALGAVVEDEPLTDLCRCAHVTSLLGICASERDLDNVGSCELRCHAHRTIGTHDKVTCRQCVRARMVCTRDRHHWSKRNHATSNRGQTRNREYEG